MYATLNVLTILFLFLKMNLGQCEYLPSCVFDACGTIIDPEYLTTSCCPQMDLFVEIINECKGLSPTIETCSQATCVVERYGILTNGEVDFQKVEQTMTELDAVSPDQAPLNALVKKYCLCGNYTCFPSEDPNCLNWKFMNCAFFAYRIGCPITYSDCACDYIAYDVDTCRPYQRRYVRELNRVCNTCLAPPAPPLREKVTGFVESRIKFIE